LFLGNVPTPLEGFPTFLVSFSGIGFGHPHSFPGEQVTVFDAATNNSET
jgi:hypothetical protein